MDAAMGPKLTKGEMKQNSQLYQNQFAQTMAKLWDIPLKWSTIAKEITGIVN
jgi:hypothetical protein